jgi:large subunit ribosomal protein L15
MTINKRKKVTKYRASTTHGGGHRKKRRGAGNRGGRGNAGSGKRGKARKQSFKKLGKQGFSSIQSRTNIQTITISSLERLVRNSRIEAKDGVYTVDLTARGYTKLLGSGKTNLKFEIKVKQYSRSAEEKINSAGGSIISANQSKLSEETKKENDES